MTSPRISILLPTYNDARTIAVAIDSVITQDCADWELLVIDDGLDQRARQLVDQYVEHNSRIRRIVNEHNFGIQRSLNRGLAVAKGAFIARIDDDDAWIDTNKLTQQLAFFDTHPDHVLLGTNAVITDDHGAQLGHYHVLTDDASIRTRMLSKNCFLHPSVMMRTHAIVQAGGYDESPETKHIEDYALWLALGSIGKVANLATQAVRLTVHTTSLTYQNRIVQAMRMRRIACAYRHAYPRFWQGQLLLSIRICGFIALKVIPLPKRWLYFIQKTYKEF